MRRIPPRTVQQETEATTTKRPRRAAVSPPVLTTASGHPLRKAAAEARIVQACASSADKPAHEVVRPSKAQKSSSAQEMELDELLTLLSTCKYDTSAHTHDCPDCSAPQKSRSHLRSHLFFQHDTYLCKTSYCSSTFTDSRKMLRHYAKEHQKGDYKCDFVGCDEEFNHRSKLEEHKLVHGEAMHKCDECEACFKFPRDLCSHKLSHTDEMF